MLAPAADAYAPAEQLKHAEAVKPVEKVPGRHVEHCCLLLAPADAKKLPTPQFEQDVAPTVLE